jgi:hypothetical protein
MNELCSSLGIIESEVIKNHHGGCNCYLSLDFGMGKPIPLAYYKYGMDPQISAISETSTSLISFDQTLVAVNLVDGEVVFSVDFFTPIYEFKTINSLALIVVVCEMNVYVLNNSGLEIWTEGYSEIITDYNIDNENIFIETEDGWSIKYSIING